MKPKSFLVTVNLQGYAENTDALSARVRACLETHPTLSMRIEAVSARETPEAPASCAGEVDLHDLE